MSSNYRAQCEKVVQAMGIRTISFAQRDNKVLMTFDVDVGGLDMSFLFIINEPGEQVVISSRPSWVMPRRLFGPTWEYITKLNYKLVYGHVDLDERDGEVRYKTSADFGKTKNIEHMIKHFMNLHSSSGKQYILSLNAMKDDGISVRTALSRLGIDDYGPSEFITDDPANSTLARALASMAGRPTPTRQESQEDLSDLLNALGLGRS